MSLPLLLFIVGMIWFFLADGEQMMVGWFIGAGGSALQVFLALTIACPNCGKSPYTIGRNWGPFGIAGKPIPDVVCSRCKHDFRTKLSDSCPP